MNEKFYHNIEFVGKVKDIPRAETFNDPVRSWKILVEIPEQRQMGFSGMKVSLLVSSMTINGDIFGKLMEGAIIFVKGKLIYDSYGYPLIHRAPNGNVECEFTVVVDELKVLDE